MLTFEILTAATTEVFFWDVTLYILSVFFTSVSVYGLYSVES
jgi:hypothetical protein